MTYLVYATIAAATCAWFVFLIHLTRWESTTRHLPEFAEFYFLPRPLVDGTRSKWCSVLVKTSFGYRHPTTEEEWDYTVQNTW